MTVYAKIENGQLITAYNGYNGIIGLADDVELLMANGFSPFDEALVSKYFTNPQQAIIKGKKLVDITDTDDYKVIIAKQQKATKMADLNAQIDALDKKRIRAICEPSVKDETSGQTWLEYYNEQIIALRAQIAAL